jgi:hypothetical protein
VRSPHWNGVSLRVSQYLLGQFLGKDLFVSGLRTEHLDDLDFLRRVFASLVHYLLMDGYYN